MWILPMRLLMPSSTISSSTHAVVAPYATAAFATAALATAATAATATATLAAIAVDASGRVDRAGRVVQPHAAVQLALIERAGERLGWVHK